MILWKCCDNIFNQKELSNIIELCDTMSLNKAVVGRNTANERIDDNIRNSKICFIERNDVTSIIYDRVSLVIKHINQQSFGFILDGYEDFQYTTYNSYEKGHYTWHMDTILNNSEKIRKLSFTLLLDDDYDGGNFEILTSSEKNARKLPVKKGRMLIFPSFIIHRVSPVISGCRKSIAGWFYGPPFK